MSRPGRGQQPETVREVEHKFRVHGLFRIPDLRDVGGVTSLDDLGAVELESTYVDTPDLRLAREGITLRRRTGDDEGWHLKLPVVPGAPVVRDEIRLPLEAGSDRPDVRPPDALVDIVRVVVRHSPLLVVATLRTHRARQLVRGAAGKPVAEFVDDTVQVIGPDGTPAARFRELELEERDGGKAVARIARALADAGAVSGEFVAKAVRALGPAASAPAEVPPPMDAGPKDAAAATVTAHLARHTRALRAADVGFRRDPSEGGEPVHQMRVAARRLRSGLRVFRPLLDRDWAEHLRTELAWAARGLTGLREQSVLLERLDRHATELPPDLPIDTIRELLSRELGRSRDAARAVAIDLLGTDRYLRLHDTLVSAANRPQFTPAAERTARDVLPGLVERQWKRLDSAVSALAPESPDDEWHRARLAAKRARYAAEAVAPSLGDDAAAFAAQIERLTDILGEHQDAVQAADVVRHLAVDTSTVPEVAFALGTLAAAERRRADDARGRFAEIWPEVRRARWRKWFTA